MELRKKNTIFFWFVWCCYCNQLMWVYSCFSFWQEAMKQTYQRALKAATDFGYQKESPEWVLFYANIIISNKIYSAIAFL